MASEGGHLSPRRLAPTSTRRQQVEPSSGSEDISWATRTATSRSDPISKQAQVPPMGPLLAGGPIDFYDFAPMCLQLAGGRELVNNYSHVPRPW